ncbi:hypothetical protein SAMN02787144_103248 [Streptomyces atratus]|uniref:Uncharacterized protein n=1 Tax=Streptomyces atratus TaxID=1893 RepID=A0A1K2F4W7_STRAR|nr:hypothetical protein SAMN02787144_103248 [Streptomyces atratus]
MEFFEHQGGSNLHLKWTEPGGSKIPVLQSAFRLPDGFAYDGAIAATVLADGRTLKLDFAQKPLVGSEPSARGTAAADAPPAPG